MSAISGVSEGDAALLKKAFGIDNIRELAENKYVTIAQATVSLASLVQILEDAADNPESNSLFFKLSGSSRLREVSELDASWNLLLSRTSSLSECL